MKKNYEIYLRQHVKGSVEDDYETTAIESYKDTYWQYLKQAKELSMHIGEVDVCGYHFAEGEHLDAGLAAVELVCYIQNDTDGYKMIHREYFENGKGEGRIIEDY